MAPRGGKSVRVPATMTSWRPDAGRLDCQIGRAAARPTGEAGRKPLPCIELRREPQRAADWYRICIVVDDDARFREGSLLNWPARSAIMPDVPTKLGGR